jgi:hypothetical protein
MVDQLSESQFNQASSDSSLALPPFGHPLHDLKLSSPLSLQLKEAFSLLDTDGDGILTSNDVQVNMRYFACDRRRYTLCFASCSCSSPASITPSTSTK